MTEAEKKAIEWAKKEWGENPYVLSDPARLLNCVESLLCNAHVAGYEAGQASERERLSGEKIDRAIAENNAIIKMLNENKKLRAALEGVSQYCKGGTACSASEHSPCHIYEHEIARAALTQPSEQDRGEG